MGGRDNLGARADLRVQQMCIRDRDVPDGSPDADPAMAIGDGEVGALVDALSPELRDVVELRFDQGFKVGEIADVLGVSRFAVNRRLNRALAELRRGLEGKDEA